MLLAGVVCCVGEHYHAYILRMHCAECSVVGCLMLRGMSVYGCYLLDSNISTMSFSIQYTVLVASYTVVTD